jgi:PAS domain S-box-containing protein
MAAPRSENTQEARLRALARLNRLVSSSLHIDEVLSAIARAAAELMKVPAVSFWIVDESARRLELGGFSDPDLFADFPTRSVSFDQGGLGYVATHRQSIHVPDVFADPRFFALEWWRAHGFKSYFATPVMLGETFLAVLAMTAREPFHLDQNETEVLDGLVAHAAVAIRNARLFAASEARRREAEALAEVGRLLSQTLDLAVVAEQIADTVRALLDVRSAGVYRLEPESGDLVVMATSAAPTATFEYPLVLPRGTGVPGLAVRQKAPVVTPDALADPRITFWEGSRVYVERSDYRAVLAVPFLVQDRVIGALAVGDRLGRVFDDTAIGLAQAFADQAALALENARLFHEADERRLLAEDAEERYRSLFDRVPVGLYRETPEGKLLDANTALAQMLGYPNREALLGVSVAEHYASPQDLQRWLALLEREGIARDFEVRLRRRDGRLIWARKSARVVRYLAGRVLYYEGVQEDVTEHKRAEEAERQAEALRSVARLANAAAHEINNPLSVVIGRLELLARHFRGDDAARGHIEQAIIAGRRISEMISHMRGITRLEVADQPPGLEPILDLKKSSEARPEGPAT